MIAAIAHRPSTVFVDVRNNPVPGANVVGSRCGDAAAKCFELLLDLGTDVSPMKHDRPVAQPARWAVKFLSRQALALASISSVMVMRYRCFEAAAQERGACARATADARRRRWPGLQRNEPRPPTAHDVNSAASSALGPIWYILIARSTHCTGTCRRSSSAASAMSCCAAQLEGTRYIPPQRRRGRYEVSCASRFFGSCRTGGLHHILTHRRAPTSSTLSGRTGSQQRGARRFSSSKPRYFCLRTAATCRRASSLQGRLKCRETLTLVCGRLINITRIGCDRETSAMRTFFVSARTQHE